MIAKASIEEIIQTTRIKGLSFIDAGSREINSSELLNNGNLSALFQELRALFDYIVIDNSPMAIMNDAKIIGHYSDLSLFILRIGYSKKEQLAYLNTISEDFDFRNQAILNNVFLNDLSFDSMSSEYFNNTRVT